MKISKILILCFLCVSFNTLAQTKTDQKNILELLNRQTNDWNTGNIDAFMEGYWKSDSLAFVGSKGPTYGWQNTLDNYKIRYPDRATMGTLKFDILRVQFLANDAVTLIGKWYLTRPERGDIGGHFTLIFKKIKNVWVIIADHTS